MMFTSTWKHITTRERERDGETGCSTFRWYAFKMQKKKKKVTHHIKRRTEVWKALPYFGQITVITWLHNSRHTCHY